MIRKEKRQWCGERKAQDEVFPWIVPCRIRYVKKCCQELVTNIGHTRYVQKWLIGQGFIGKNAIGGRDIEAHMACNLHLTTRWCLELSLCAE
jgi:hypothetical protein